MLFIEVQCTGNYELLKSVTVIINVIYRKRVAYLIHTQAIEPNPLPEASTILMSVMFLSVSPSGYMALSSTGFARYAVGERL